MKSDEGIFRMLSKSSIIRNQYENVTCPDTQKFKTPEKSSSLAFFFIFIFNVFSMSLASLFL